MDKYEFVEKLLKPLLMECDSSITDVSYTKNNREEYVAIDYSESKVDLICVTCDSKLAIVKDVLKKFSY